MRLRGFEPPRAQAHRLLRTVCLPFHHSRSAAKPSACSRLQTDVFLHRRDARAAIYPHVSLVRAVLDIDEVADVHEQLADLRGSVAELVREVGVAAGAIDEYTAVGANAAPEEAPRLALENRDLPLLERDDTFVLPPGTVLRKEASQMRAVEADDRRRALACPERANAMLGETASKERLCVGDDPGVAGVEEQAQAIAPACPHDVPVPEIKLEQFRVIRLGEDDRLQRRPPAAGADPDRPERVLRTAPIADGCPREPETPGDLAVVHAGLYEGKCGLSCGRRMHEHMFVSRPDG